MYSSVLIYKKVSFFLTLFILTVVQLSISQIYPQKSIQIGFGLASDLSTRKGTISKDLTSRIAFRFNSNVYMFEQSEFRLGYEIGYNHLKGYRFAEGHIVASEYKIYHEVYDEYHELSFGDIGLFPEYNISLGNDFVVGARIGFSIGLGTEYLTVNRLSKTFIDSTKYLNNDPMYGAYGEYNLGSFRLPRSYQVGANIIFKRYDLECRFVRGDSGNPGSYHRIYNNIVIIFGILF